LKAVVFVSTRSAVDFLHKLYTYAHWPPNNEEITTVPDSDDEEREGVEVLTLSLSLAYP
jgi:hypothetical protein